MKKIQLSIPEPCHQNWDDMTPMQQGRFCNACAKQVIDFSTMSDTEVLNYFSKVKNENVCGRTYPDQLDRNIAATPKRKFYWYLNYAVAFFLFLGKTNNAKAQGMMMIVKEKKLKPVKPGFMKTAPKPSINGTIKDENGEAIPFASVKLLQSSQGVIANEKGAFVLKIDNLNCSIEISALNYATKQAMVNDFFEKEIVLKKSNLLMKEVVINASGYSSGMVRAMAGGVQVRYEKSKREIIKDTITNLINTFKPSIKIYPNPVPKGNAFTVALTLKQTGNYSVLLTDAAGRLLLQQKINTVTKEHKEQLLSSSNWSTGIYFIKVLDEKGKLTGTGSMEVQ